MPYVKLDTAILNSTLWFERLAREIFITSLLMAEPYEVVEETEALEVDSLKPTGFKVHPGWYGFVHAAGIGILRRTLLDDTEEMRKAGFDALRYLGGTDHESRSKDHEGRRMVRVDGGFIILNYFKYRDKDHTNALRQRRHRLKQRNTVMSRSNGVIVTHTDAYADVQGTNATSVPKSGSYPESTKTPINNPIVPSSRSPRRQASDDAYTSEFEKFWEEFPHKKHKRAAFKAWKKALQRGISPETMIAGIEVYQASEREKWNKYENYSPLHPAKWINADGWEDQSAMKIHRKPTKYAEETHDYLS